MYLRSTQIITSDIFYFRFRLKNIHCVYRTNFSFNYLPMASNSWLFSIVITRTCNHFCEILFQYPISGVARSCRNSTFLVFLRSDPQFSITVTSFIFLPTTQILPLFQPLVNTCFISYSQSSYQCEMKALCGFDLQFSKNVMIWINFSYACLLLASVYLFSLEDYLFKSFAHF